MSLGKASNMLKKLNAITIWERLTNNQDFVIVNALLVLKVVAFSVAVGFGIGHGAMAVSTAAILLILSCWFLFLPSFARTSVLLVFDFLISTALLADILFYRFFHNVISVPVLFEARQVGGVSSSLETLFSGWDLLLFLDFLFLIPYFVRFSFKRKKQPLMLRRALSQVVAILLVCGVTLGLTTKSVAAQFSKNAYIGLNWDDTVLKNMGVVNYHLFDLFSFVKENTAKGSLLADIQQLNAWMSNRVAQDTNKYTGIAQREECNYSSSGSYAKLLNW